MRTLPLRPLGFGEIVDGASQLYRRDWALYYLIALLGHFPGHLLQLAFDVDPESSLAQALAVLLGVFLFVFLGWVAVAAAMAERLEARPVSVGRAYWLALRHLPRASGAAMVSSAILGAVALFGLVLATSAFRIAAGLGGMGPVSQAVLAVAVVAVVAAWLGATLGILPAVIVEGRKAMSALNRSFRLCEGAWLRVMGVAVVASIIVLVPESALSGLEWIHGVFTAPDGLGQSTGWWQWMESLVLLVAGPMFDPFAIGCFMLLFHDRRVRTEAFDLETLAESMDPP